LTIILDVPAVDGIGRLTSKDRLEEEPLEFHERVRQEFLNLANVDPDRYVVIDGRQSVEAIHAAIRERVSVLPLLKINKKAK
jgi:dTMP kinase